MNLTLLAVSLWVVAQATSPQTTPPTEPVLLDAGKCQLSVGDLPCEKYAYNGRAYIVVWKDGELYRIDRFNEDGSVTNIYQAPPRTWT